MNRILRSRGPEREDSAAVTIPEVEAALAEITESKAAGQDGLHQRLLKLLPVDAMSVVCKLFELLF